MLSYSLNVNILEALFIGLLADLFRCTYEQMLPCDPFIIKYLYALLAVIDQNIV